MQDDISFSCSVKDHKIHFFENCLKATSMRMWLQYSLVIKIESFNDPNEIIEEKDVYTYEEFQKFISASPDLNTRVMFEILYYCGLRRGEARGLQWTDIKWRDHLVSITKQANSVKDHLTKCKH